jgi:hypothetical protein
MYVTEVCIIPSRGHNNCLPYISTETRRQYLLHHVHRNSSIVILDRFVYEAEVMPVTRKWDSDGNEGES